MMDKQKLKKLLIGEFSLKRMVKSFLFIYLCLCIYAWFFTDNKIFLPQPASYTDNPDIIKLQTDDKIKISALYLPNKKAKYTILYSHGNASDIGQVKTLLLQLQNMGFSVFAYDYQGYGTSEGKPSESNAYKDINTAYNYLTKNLKIPSKQIIIYGHSVGTGPSTDLASHEPVGGLILESPFISAFRVVTNIPIVPFDKFNNISKIKQVRCPILIMHGKIDDIIPFWHGEKLFNTANQPKIFFAVEQAGHNDIPDIAGIKYQQQLQDFLRIIS
jgi:abhydrolase domain-containing protein 17